MTPIVRFLAALCALALALWPVGASADVRHFTFLYEATPPHPGSIDIENSATFKTGTDDGARFNQVDFRHEFEFGVTNRLQLSLYVADWDYHSGLTDRPSGVAYDATAVEAIYNLTNPVADPVGISIYEEIRGGDRVFESESKIILRKDFGPWIAAYNATVEATWEGSGLREQEGELQQALGLSYEVMPALSVGLEMVHEIVLPDWSTEHSANNFFVGPNLSVRHGQGFVTVTALAQATQTPGEADLQVRTIVGFAF
jgi:hypothetical protein